MMVCQKLGDCVWRVGHLLGELASPRPFAIYVYVFVIFYCFLHCCRLGFGTIYVIKMHPRDNSFYIDLTIQTKNKDPQNKPGKTHEHTTITDARQQYVEHHFCYKTHLTNILTTCGWKRNGSKCY